MPLTYSTSQKQIGFIHRNYMNVIFKFVIIMINSIINCKNSLNFFDINKLGAQKIQTLN